MKRRRRHADPPSLDFTLASCRCLESDAAADDASCLFPFAIHIGANPEIASDRGEPVTAVDGRQICQMIFTDQGKSVTLLSVGSAMSTARVRNRYPEAFATTPTRYRLDVVASTVDDVIVSAGGWLFDRAMAGWEVSLLIAEPSDARPLQILGISALPLDKALEPVANWAPTQAIAVAAEVFDADQRVRRNVVAALDRGLIEVTLWGDSWPPGFHRRAGAVEHRLSAAARAFKAHALSAAQLPPGSITETEQFRSGSRWCPPYERDLVPIG